MSQSSKKGGFAALYDLAEKKKAEQISPVKPETPVDTPVSTPVNTPAPTPVPTPVDTPVLPSSSVSPSQGPSAAKTPESADTEDKRQYLDATHTASEKSLYSVMYRETVSRGVKERHFGFKELSAKTGIRSDRTIRVALQSLREKLSIEVISYHHGSPLGPRYRIYDPREIMRRRKAAGIEIDTQTKRITSLTPVLTPVATGVSTGVPTGGKIYGSTPVEITGVTPVDSTGVYKYRNEDLALTQTPGFSSSNKQRADDEAFAKLVQLLKETAKEVTGRDPTGADADRWSEVAEILATELRIASARTSVSSAPAFLAEHLRRRLRKTDAKQIEREVSEASREAAAVTPARPDLNAEQLQEQVNRMVQLMRGGASIEELDEQFSGNFRPVQWHMIRGMALTQFGVNRR